MSLLVRILILFQYRFKFFEMFEKFILQTLFELFVLTVFHQKFFVLFCL